MNAPSPAAPSLLRRLTALLYDSLLVIPMLMAAVAAALGAGRGLGWLAAEVQLPPWIVWVLAVSCSTLFFTIFWMRGGQTLGMQAWRLRLVSSDGSALHWGQCLLRCAGAALSIAALGCGYWWSLIDREKRCWHDRLSRTHLLLQPKRERR